MVENVDKSTAMTAANWGQICALYDKTAPRTWNGEAKIDAWQPFAFACLSRMRGLVESIASLENRDADCGTLVRVLFEHAVTFAWLMIEPAEHQRQFLRWELNQRAKIYRDMREHGVLTSEDESAIERERMLLEGGAAVKAAPELPDRAFAADKHWSAVVRGQGYQLRSMYGWIWRTYSAHVHPTWAGLVWQIREDGDALRFDGSRAFDPHEPLCLAVLLFADTLRVASLSLGWPELKDIPDAYLPTRGPLS
jgi:Family of unknown function (DUF5677)